MAKAFKVTMDLTSLKKGFALRETATARLVELAVKEGAQDIQGHAVEAIQKGGTGNIYDRVQLDGYKGIFLVSGGKRVPVAFVPDDGSAPPNGRHQASAAGEAPATDSGELVSGLQIDTVTSTTVKIANVRSLAPYSGLLERGTSKIKARPFMGPAFNASLPTIMEGIKTAIHKGFRKGDDGQS